MYRSASYNPFNESVFLRTWSEEGVRIETEIPFRPYLFLEKEGADDATSIFKTSLVKKQLKNSMERKRFVDSTANKRIFHNLAPEQQFLSKCIKIKTTSRSFLNIP